MPNSLRVRTHQLSDDWAAQVFGLLQSTADPSGAALDVKTSSVDDFEPLQAGCFVTRLDCNAEQPSALLRELAEVESAMSVVYLVESPKLKAIVDVMRCGACDVLDWPAERDLLGRSVEQSLERSSKKHLALVEARVARERFAVLSAGEADVLKLLLSGKANKAIAGRLGISLRTVEARRKRVFEKLKSRNLAEIARTMMKAGLLGSTDASDMLNSGS